MTLLGGLVFGKRHWTQILNLSGWNRFLFVWNFILIQTYPEFEEKYSDLTFFSFENTYLKFLLINFRVSVCSKTVKVEEIYKISIKSIRKLNKIFNTFSPFSISWRTAIRTDRFQNQQFDFDQLCSREQTPKQI
mgnify:FL=1